MLRLRATTAVVSACFAATALVAAGPRGASTPLVFDDEDQRQCSVLDWAAPAAVAVDHLIGDELKLRVHVLLDSSVNATHAHRLLNDAATITYENGLRVVTRLTWGRVSVPSGEVTTEDAFAIAKAAVGGTRPAGADLVYLLTDADLVSGTTGNSVAGQADCIGGIMHPTEAFAIGEFDERDVEGRSLLGLGYFDNITGKVFAHEIGHLLGAHHHYANCAEGAHSDPIGDALSACTLMINDVGLASLNLSVVNSAVARGHVAEFGGANQR